MNDINMEIGCLKVSVQAWKKKQPMQVTARVGEGRAGFFYGGKVTKKDGVFFCGDRSMVTYVGSGLEKVLEAVVDQNVELNLTVCC